MVGSGGLEVVASAGVTSGALVLGGGIEDIGFSGFEGGSAVGMTVNGGAAFINSGGDASGTSVVNGGVLTVFSGGTDSHASVGSGGTVNVSSGGMDIHASVGSGGTLNVSAGGVVSALTLNDPNDPGVTAAVNVLSGGTVDGATKIDGGQLILDAGAVFQAHASLAIINSGWLILEQDSFKGTIKDFGGSDELDLTKIRFTGATTETFTPSGAGGTLQVQAGSHVADLRLTGTYATANFALASDGAHGTLVTFVP